MTRGVKYQEMGNTFYVLEHENSELSSKVEVNTIGNCI